MICNIMMRKRRMPDLYRAPFPLYSIKVDPEMGLVIIAGGGGPSKTGIKNAVVSNEYQTKHAHVVYLRRFILT